MTNILRYALSVLIPVGYLIWLAVVVLSGASNEHILAIVNLGILFLIPVNWIMPRQKNPWKWVCFFLASLVFGSYVWFEFQLSPPDERLFTPVWIAIWSGLIGGVWLCNIAYRKWWPGLSMMPKVIMAAFAIILSGGATVYLLSIFLKGVNWHDVLIANWYVTVLVLYLPVFLGVLFLRRTLEKRKSERKNDAQTPVA